MKQRGRMIIDIAMTVMLLCQMAYMLVGEDLHEWMGTAMFVLFIAHHVVNRRWYGNLFKGRYTPFRVMQVIVNVLLLLAMLGLMVSGIIMSRIVFDFLPIEGGTAFARTVHMLASYWGFILMSMHLGMHWGMVMEWYGSCGERTAQTRRHRPAPWFSACWLRPSPCTASMLL